MKSIVKVGDKVHGVIVRDLETATTQATECKCRFAQETMDLHFNYQVAGPWRLRNRVRSKGLLSASE